MIDHIVNFPDEDAAKADPVVGKYWFAGSDSEPVQEGGWRTDNMIPGLSVYRVTGTEIITPSPLPPPFDEQPAPPPYEQEIHEPYPGWFALISLPQLSEELRDLPAEACWIIADRTLAETQDDFVLYLAPSFNQADLPITNISPQFAGSNYPFHRALLKGATR